MRSRRIRSLPPAPRLSPSLRRLALWTVGTLAFLLLLLVSLLHFSDEPGRGVGVAARLKERRRARIAARNTAGAGAGGRRRRRRKRTDVSEVLLVSDPNEGSPVERTTRPPDPPSTWKLDRPLPAGYNPEHRIAIVIPFLSGGDDVKRNSLPPYFDLFASTAGGSRSLVDFLIFHDGLPDHVLPTSENDGGILPPNVKLIDLGSTQGMAELFVRVADERNLSDEKRTSLVETLGRWIGRYPYVLVEFKAALGHVFADYLTDYSHWGYADLDIAFGDLPRWISGDELTDYDIVTYGYGDQGRVYIRGQFTFHKNNPKINQLWRGCDFLSEIDERFAKAAAGETKLHFESAEGCYSSVVLNRKDLRVKYAAKAFTDVQDRDHFTEHAYVRDRTYRHGLYVGVGRDGDRTVLYKEGEVDGGGADLLSSSPTWFEDAGGEYAGDAPLQREVGPLLRVETLADRGKTDVRCMFWAPQKYQKDLCAVDVDSDHTGECHLAQAGDADIVVVAGFLRMKDEDDGACRSSLLHGFPYLFAQFVSNTTVQLGRVRFTFLAAIPSVFLIDGVLYKRKHEITPLPLGIKSFPFFHFQEWKRYYRSSQLSSLRRSNGSLGWVISKEGAFPMVPPPPSLAPLVTSDVDVPLVTAEEHVEDWLRRETADKDRDNLPTSLFCLRSSKKKFPPVPATAACDELVSWQDEDGVKILHDGGHEWKKIDAQQDVTLVLTLQLAQRVGDGADVPGRLMDLAEANVRAWDGQPCVLLIHVAGVSEELVGLVHGRFGSSGAWIDDARHPGRSRQDAGGNNDYLAHCLIGAIFSEGDDSVSRKALLNMASEAAPTRWVVIGTEVERGLILSRESILFAYRAISVHRDDPGNVFIIPQFASKENISFDEDTRGIGFGSVGIKDLLNAKGNKKTHLTSSLASMDCVQCRNDHRDTANINAQVDEIWWDLTTSEVTGVSGKYNEGGSAHTDELITSLVKLRLSLIGLLSVANEASLQNFDTFPILLLDKIGPRASMNTFDLVREVEEFGGRCFDALRLSQLAALGYTIRVLPGAFALSLPSTRDAICAQWSRQNHNQKDGNRNIGSSRCDGCFMLEESILHDIIKDERGRVAKAGLLWHEWDELKVTH